MCVPRSGSAGAGDAVLLGMERIIDQFDLLCKANLQGKICLHCKNVSIGPIDLIEQKDLTIPFIGLVDFSD
jgi:hypothetical protein